MAVTRVVLPGTVAERLGIDVDVTRAERLGIEPVARKDADCFPRFLITLAVVTCKEIIAVTV